MEYEKRPRVPDISSLVGENGPWQRRPFFMTFSVAIPLALHMMLMSFYAPNLEHWCARPPAYSNYSIRQWHSTGLPPSDPKCSRYDLLQPDYRSDALKNATWSIVPCDRWEYDESYYGSTLLSKYDLVCDREWFISLSKSIYIGGFLVSVILFGYLSDRFGRKPVVGASLLIGLLASTASAFSHSFLMFAVCRFFVALGSAGAFTTTFVLMMEVVGSEYRSVYGMSINFGWCVGYILLPGIVYAIRDWFWTQLLITAPFIILLPAWWLMPESPRWLLMRGRMDEARDIVTRAAVVNGLHLADDLDESLRKISQKTLQESQSKSKNETIISLFRYPELRGRSLNIFFVWFVTAFVYFGLSFNTNELAGDPFVNFAVSGVVEVPAYAVALLVIHTLGRRWPQAASLLLAGVAYLLSYPLPPEPRWLGVAVLMLGKSCVTSSFGIMYVYTAELFPTVLRNQALGACSLCGRLGSIVAPFVKEMGGATHPVVPQLVFGVLSVCSGLLVLLLPETKDAPVPDTLLEMAAISRKRKQVPDKTDDATVLKELCAQDHNKL